MLRKGVKSKTPGCNNNLITDLEERGAVLKRLMSQKKTRSLFPFAVSTVIPVVSPLPVDRDWGKTTPLPVLIAQW